MTHPVDPSRVAWTDTSGSWWQAERWVSDGRWDQGGNDNANSWSDTGRDHGAWSQWNDGASYYWSQTTTLDHGPGTWSQRQWDDGANQWDDGANQWDDGANQWDDGANQWDDGANQWTVAPTSGTVAPTGGQTMATIGLAASETPGLSLSGRMGSSTTRQLKLAGNCGAVQSIGLCSGLLLSPML